MATSNSTPIYTTLTDVTIQNCDDFAAIRVRMEQLQLKH
jgi:hypothetical protein